MRSHLRRLLRFAILCAIAITIVWRLLLNPSHDTVTTARNAARIDAEQDAKRDPEAAEGAAHGNETRAEITSEPHGVELCGHVRDLTGDAIALASVVLERWSPDDASRRDTLRCASDGDGSYRFRDVEPGSWIMRVVAEGHRSVSGPLELKPSKTHRRIDVALRACRRYEVFLEFAGRSDPPPRYGPDALDLNTVVTLQAPGRELSETQGTASEQLASVPPSVLFKPSDPWAVLVASIDAPFFVSVVSHHSVLVTQRITQTEGPIHLTIPAGELDDAQGGLRARLIDGNTGAPVANAKVLLDGLGTTRDGWSDADGIVVLSAIAVGEGDLSVTARGYGRYEAIVTIERRSVSELGTVKLFAPCALPVIVVDRTGKPAATDIVIQRHAVMTGMPSHRRGKSEPGCRVGDSGRAVIDGLGRDLYVLFRWPWRSDPPLRESFRPAIVDTRSGVVAPVTLVVEPTTLVALEYQGHKAPVCSFRIEDENQVPCWSHELSGSVPTIGLLRGSYRAIVFRDGEQQSAWFTVVDAPLRVPIPALPSETSPALLEPCALDSAVTIDTEW